MSKEIVLNENNIDGPKPVKTTKIIKWTVEVDCSIEIDDSKRDNDSLISGFIFGEFNDIEPKITSERISNIYGIKVEEIKHWSDQ